MVKNTEINLAAGIGTRFLFLTSGGLSLTCFLSGSMTWSLQLGSSRRVGRYSTQILYGNQQMEAKDLFQVLKKSPVECIRYENDLVLKKQNSYTN